VRAPGKRYGSYSRESVETLGNINDDLVTSYYVIFGSQDLILIHDLS
jgi:hypothetical protein